MKKYNKNTAGQTTCDNCGKKIMNYELDWKYENVNNDNQEVILTLCEDCRKNNKYYLDKNGDIKKEEK